MTNEDCRKSLWVGIYKQALSIHSGCQDAATNTANEAIAAYDAKFPVPTTDEQATFTRRDLADFGLYMVSDQRRKDFASGPDGAHRLEERLKHVYHSDVENFLEERRNQTTDYTNHPPAPASRADKDRENWESMLSMKQEELEDRELELQRREQKVGDEEKRLARLLELLRELREKEKALTVKDGNLQIYEAKLIDREHELDMREAGPKKVASEPNKKHLDMDFGTYRVESEVGETRVTFDGVVYKLFDSGKAAISFSNQTHPDKYDTGLIVSSCKTIAEVVKSLHAVMRRIQQPQQ